MHTQFRYIVMGNITDKTSHIIILKYKIGYIY